MQNDKIFKKINNTYQCNLEQIEKSLFQIGINIRKSEKELKSISEILEEISEKWDELSKEENKYINKWICMSIAGIKDENYLRILIDELNKKNEKINIEQEYIKFIKFRTELIELLDKYRYQISGTNLDDGSMNIENKNGVVYILRDSYSDYEALDFDWNLLSTDYILNMFPEDNNSPIKNNNIGIFSNNYNKVSMLFDDLYNKNKENVKRFRRSKEEINLLLEDDRYFVWIKPIDNSRSWRCSKVVYIDSNLTLNELQYNVMPICCYCKREDVRVF